VSGQDTPEGNGGTILHAGCVALAGRGVLILGPSGSGKSGLALQLMAYGCDLVSDDRTEVRPRDGGVWARAPKALRNKIEARGIGLLAADAISGAPLCLAVDLGKPESERLPPLRTLSLLGHELPVLHRYESDHFPAAILQYLRGGRLA
jgi:HPr kinase/phosphorylase